MQTLINEFLRILFKNYNKIFCYKLYLEFKRKIVVTKIKLKQ